jgi:electron transfer flavoprotein alpha subunit
MAYLEINHEKIDVQTASRLEALCPFGAITQDDLGKIDIGEGCRLCKKCVSDESGAITFIEEQAQKIDKSLYKGITVFLEQVNGDIHPVGFELIGKALSLANESNESVSAVLVGRVTNPEKILQTGISALYYYDDPTLDEFLIDPYVNAVSDFISRFSPSVFLVGATVIGRSLAPRVAARFKTGLTADCTQLEIDPETSDLIQIRPAFGGNIMARITTPNSRPQLATVRYKVFSSPTETTKPKGELIRRHLEPDLLISPVKVLSRTPIPEVFDITESKVIIALGRGIKARKDLDLIENLAKHLNAQLAATRPLIEYGWFDPRRQIGLSGRTVAPDLIITLGISGSVQFVAGMKGAAKIIAVNTDKNAPIFDVAHVGIVGDLYEILPLLEERLIHG